MIIENRLNMLKIRMYFIILISLIIFGGLYLAFEGIMYHKIIAGLVVVFILGYIYLHILQPYYLMFKVDKGQLQVRYYYAHPGLHKPKAFIIPLKDFAGYEIKKSVFPGKIKVILQQKTAKGVASYPALSLSAMPSPGRDKLHQLLEKISKSKKQPKIKDKKLNQ